MNLAPADVLSTLLGAWSTPRGESFKVEGEPEPFCLQRILFVCAMNPPEWGGNKSPLPTPLRPLVAVVKVEEMPDEQVKEIFMTNYAPQICSPEAEKTYAESFFNKVHLEVKMLIANLGCKGHAWAVNLRHIQNLAAVHRGISKVASGGAKLQGLPLRLMRAYACQLVYAQRLPASLTFQDPTIGTVAVRSRVEELIASAHDFEPKELQDLWSQQSSNISSSMGSVHLTHQVGAAEVFRCQVLRGQHAGCIPRVFHPSHAPGTADGIASAASLSCIIGTPCSQWQSRTMPCHATRSVRFWQVFAYPLAGRAFGQRARDCPHEPPLYCPNASGRLRCCHCWRTRRATCTDAERLVAESYGRDGIRQRRRSSARRAVCFRRLQHVVDFHMCKDTASAVRLRGIS